MPLVKSCTILNSLKFRVGFLLLGLARYEPHSAATIKLKKNHNFNNNKKGAAFHEIGPKADIVCKSQCPLLVLRFCLCHHPGT